MFLCDVIKLFPRWPFVFRSFLLPPLVARDVVTPNKINMCKLLRNCSFVPKQSCVTTPNNTYDENYSIRRGHDRKQTTDYRRRTADRVHNAYQVQNVHCILQSGCKMHTENLNCFFLWYVIKSHLTTYQVSRNRFCAIIFYDHLLYCAIFLACFLIYFVFNKPVIALVSNKAATILVKTISSLHIVWFSHTNISVLTKQIRDKNTKKVKKWSLTKTTEPTAEHPATSAPFIYIYREALKIET